LPQEFQDNRKFGQSKYSVRYNQHHYISILVSTSRNFVCCKSGIFYFCHFVLITVS
jgi:hypothetical protein